ncbi:EamA family transporter [Kineococcus sp. R8]|uniref:EamA family transporter n=1 Tax=Kineococcus siccus TaxID=2696567 RepID=UPI001411F57F|nr:EamA family transporter [Kineococcus siccus]
MRTPGPTTPATPVRPSRPRAARSRRVSRVDVVLLLVAVVWGSSYLAAQRSVEGVGVAATLALRSGGAALVLGLVVLARRRAVRRRDVALGLVFGATQTAVLGLETQGVATTSATSAGLLISTTVLFTPLVEGLFTRRLLPPSFFAAGIVVLAGVGLLVGREGPAAPAVGDLLVLAAAVVRAVHVTLLGRATRGRDVDLVVLSAVQAGVGAVVVTLLAPGAVLAGVASAGAEQWLLLAHLAVGCTAFAFLAQSWALRRASAARTSLLLGTEPLWAVLFGLVVAGDQLGWVGAAGAALVVAGAGWGQRVEQRFEHGPGWKT